MLNVKVNFLNVKLLSIYILYKLVSLSFHIIMSKFVLKYLALMTFGFF